MMVSALYNIFLLILMNSLQSEGQETKKVYGILNKDVTLTCPLRKKPSENLSLLWFGPPYDGQIGTIYITSNDGASPNTVLGNRLSVTGDHSAGEYNVKISNFQQSDTGTYRCEYGTERMHVELRLYIMVSSVDISPQTIAVTEGLTSEQVVCTTSESDPIANISWYILRRDSMSPLEITNEINSTPQNKRAKSTLTFYGKYEDNDGSLYCNASNSRDFIDAQSNLVPVTVYYTPSNIRIIPPKNPYVVFVGQKGVNLSCQVDNPATVTYSWSYDGRIISNMSSFELTVTKASEGIYKCKAKNSAGITEAEISIAVQYGPEIDAFLKQKVTEGSQFLLNCSVSSKPDIKSTEIWWTRENDNKYKQIGNQLRLPNILRNQSDIYICHARNTLTPSDGEHFTVERNRSVEIEVLYKPTLNLSPKFNPFYVYVGQKNIILKCMASAANPDDVNFQWDFLNDTKYGDTFSMESVLHSSGGKYICNGSNLVGFSTVETEILVQYGPNIKPLNIRHIIEGNDDIIRCVVSAMPAAAVIWYGADRFVQHGTELKLNNTKRTQSGIYICNAINILTPSGMDTIQREANASVEIDVLYKPNILQMSNVSVVEGQALEVFCNVSANPRAQMVKWLKANDKTFQQLNNALTIFNITRHQSGTYTCRAVNQMNPSVGISVSGVGNGDVHVDVLYPPETKPSLTGYTSGTILHEGDGFLEMSCKISVGNPLPRLRMTCFNASKDGFSTDTDTEVQLMLRIDRRLNNQMCICTTFSPSNKLSYNISASVTFKVSFLRVDIAEKYYNCDNAASIIMRCTALFSKLPFYFISWQHIIANTTIRFLNSSLIRSNESILSIDICGYQDFGVYKCRADNGIFRSKASTELEIYAEPVLARMPTIQINSLDVEFLVDFYSVPKPKFPEWYKDGERLYVSEKYQQKLLPSYLILTIHGKKVEVPGYRARMLISRPGANDFGNYRLKLVNSKGSSEMEVKYDETIRDNLLRTTTTTTDSTLKDAEGQETVVMLYGGAIGGGLGFIVIAVLISVIGCIIFRKRKQRKESNNDNMQNCNKDDSYEAIRRDPVRYSNVYEQYQLYETPTY